MTVWAESDIDGDAASPAMGDAANGCVYLYKPTLDTNGDPVSGATAATCDGAAAMGPPYGQPTATVASGDTKF